MSITKLIPATTLILALGCGDPPSSTATEGTTSGEGLSSGEASISTSGQSTDNGTSASASAGTSSSTSSTSTSSVGTTAPPHDLPGVCGDGTLDPEEACDDGNNSDADACLSSCATSESCCQPNPAGESLWTAGYLSAAVLSSGEGVYRAFGRDRGFVMTTCGEGPGTWGGSVEFQLADTQPWASAPSVKERALWEGPGVTGTVRHGGRQYLFSGTHYYVLNAAGAPETWSWSASGDLADLWAELPEVEGRSLLGGAGITAAWRDGQAIVLANTDATWVFQPNGEDPSAWALLSSAPLTSLPHWSEAPPVDDLRPGEGPGITGAWVDHTRKLFGLVSEDRYWLLDNSALNPARWRWVAAGKLPQHNPFTRVEGLTILTYNIASAMPGVYGEPSQMLEKLAGYLRDHRVDIAGLQEVDVGTTRHAKADMPTILLQKLEQAGYPMAGRFENRFGWYGGQFGNMIVSRHGLDGYGAQTVVKNVNAQWFSAGMCGGPVRFVNYHPFPGDAACDATDPHYLNIVANLAGQTRVLTGDFNAGPGWSCYEKLAALYDDTCVVAGEPSCTMSVDVGWHPGHQEIRIDHIFYDREAVAPYEGAWRAIWAFSDHNVNEGVDISDHFPVMSRIVNVAP